MRLGTTENSPTSGDPKCPQMQYYICNMASRFLEFQSRNLLEERATKYCGLARVHIDFLLFSPDLTPHNYNYNMTKIKRMKRIFRQEGCDRANPRHRIYGNVSSEALSTALDVSRLSLAHLNNNTDPPMLYLPPNTFVHCAQGKSRVRAFIELCGGSLGERDQWWTIELYKGKTFA